MTSIKERALRDDLSFGARVTGANLETLKDESVRKQIRGIFENRGLIVFEEMEPSSQLQLAVSDIFGPLQDHALRGMAHVDQDSMPGVVDLNYKDNIFEIDGATLNGWVPWHFDACYTSELNRGGVLRAIDIPPEGGLTGYADGIQIYEAVSPELRAEFANKKIIYHAKLMFMNQRFGRPKKYRVISLHEDTVTLIKLAESATRSIHPVIWKRSSGEHVLHLSPWQAAGIREHEDPEGDALLESLCQEMYAKMKPYYHKWKPTDMLAWDNWRFVHSVSGNEPKYSRRMHRTTIKGDYGLGCFENDAGNRTLKMSV
jgi:taurine dioxygenase